MKPARIVVLVIAVAAGGIAALLAGRVRITPPPRSGPGGADRNRRRARRQQTISASATRSTPPDCAGRLWPAAAAGANFRPQERAPDAIKELTGSIARAAFFGRRADPRNQADQGQGLGYMAAILPSGMRAISTEISPETGAGGFILPNDHVDVILTAATARRRRPPASRSHTSETILSNVRVLAIDQTSRKRTASASSVGKTATLELRRDRPNARAVAPARHAHAGVAQHGRCRARPRRRSDDERPTSVAASTWFASASPRHDAEMSRTRGSQWRTDADPHAHCWSPLTLRSPASSQPVAAPAAAARTAHADDPGGRQRSDSRFVAARHRQVGGDRPAARRQGRAGGRSAGRQRGRPLGPPRLHHRRRRSARPTSSSSTPKGARSPASTSRSPATSTACAPRCKQALPDCRHTHRRRRRRRRADRHGREPGRGAAPPSTSPRAWSATATRSSTPSRSAAATRSCSR